MLPPTVILNAPNLLCATTRGFEDVPTDGYLIDSAATTHISHVWLLVLDRSRSLATAALMFGISALPM